MGLEKRPLDDNFLGFVALGILLVGASGFVRALTLLQVKWSNWVDLVLWRQVFENNCCKFYQL